MENITVLIYTYNSADHIQESIESARLLTSNIIVVDQHSSDETIRLAKGRGVMSYAVPYHTYVEPVRELGINRVKTEWVFILDADERMTKELAEEIKSVVTKRSFQRKLRSSHIDSRFHGNDNIGAFKVPRKNIFGRKKWLKHGGWWPDYQIRLLNKTNFKGWPTEIHSTPILEGTIDHLQNPMLHYFHGDFEKMVEKTAIFEEIESNLLFNAHKDVSTFIFFRKFLGELYRRLIKWYGFLDGQIGIIESIYQAFSKTITYLYLYEKKKSGSVRSVS